MQFFKSILTIITHVIYIFIIFSLPWSNYNGIDQSHKFIIFEQIDLFFLQNISFFILYDNTVFIWTMYPVIISI